MGKTKFTYTAAAVSALQQAAGNVEKNSIGTGMEFLRIFKPPVRVMPPDGDRFYFYGNYYAAQVMWASTPEEWERWYLAMRDDLLARRNKDGYWSDIRISPHYATAVGLIIL